MDNCVSIWLPVLTERYNIIKKLENDLKTIINIFNAVDGNDFLNEFKNFRHVLYGQKINAGMVGCVLSHLELLKRNQTITIFEDDCIFTAQLDTLNSFISSAPDFDILCLGVSEIVEADTSESNEYNRLFRFWGTHALIVKADAAKKIVDTFEKYASQHIFLPADWLYSIAIKEHNLKAYGPKKINQFFDYKRGIYSVVANRIRN